MQTGSSFGHADASPPYYYLPPKDLTALAQAVAPVEFGNSSEQVAMLELVVAVCELDRRYLPCRRRSDRKSCPKIAPVPVL